MSYLGAWNARTNKRNIRQAHLNSLSTDPPTPMERRSRVEEGPSRPLESLRLPVQVEPASANPDCSGRGEKYRSEEGDLRPLVGLVLPSPPRVLLRLRVFWTLLPHRPYHHLLLRRLHCPQLFRLPREEEATRVRQDRGKPPRMMPHHGCNRSSGCRTPRKGSRSWLRRS